MPVEIDDHGRVRVLAMTDPARHNRVSREMAVAIAGAIDAFSGDVLISTGAGEKSSAREWISEQGDGLTPADGLTFERDVTWPVAWDATTQQRPDAAAGRPGSIDRPR